MIPATHETIKFVGGNASDDVTLGTGTQVSSAIDTLGYREAIFVLYAGTLSTGTTDVTITECDTSGGSYAAITGAAFTQVTSSNDNALYVGRINLDGRKRYLKVSAVIATAASEHAVVVALANPISAAVSQTNTLAFNLDPA